MTDLGTNTIRPIASGANERMGANGEPTMALRARDDIEQVAIEKVHVGDYLLLEPHGRPISARCVISKHAKANDRTARIVGWLLELAGGGFAWWPRGASVWRRRLEAHA